MRCFILLVAEVPKWISRMVEDSEIDFAILKHFQPKTTAELVAHFDENLEGAKKALQVASDEDLAAPFALKSNGELIYSSPNLTFEKCIIRLGTVVSSREKKVDLSQSWLAA